MTWILPVTAFAFLPLFQAKANRGGAQKMSFKAPVLDDESQWSAHVPSTLTCEGCKAITYTVNIS